jgi:hypothetical protein
MMTTSKNEKNVINTCNVATLVVGLWPMQGGCKVTSQEGDSGVISHALGSAKSVRAWTSHSQGNSHVGS